MIPQVLELFFPSGKIVKASSFELLIRIKNNTDISLSSKPHGFG
jgi:transcriptional antiterminator